MALITVADAKTQLNIPPSDTSQDAELAGFVSAAIAAVDGALPGPTTPALFTERVAGDRATLCLSKTPVVSVQAVLGVVAGAPMWNTADLIVDEAAGTITSQSYSYGGFIGPQDVIYTAGYEAPTDDMRMAALLTVQDLWRSQRSTAARNQSEGPPDNSAEIARLLQPYTRSGFA